MIPIHDDNPTENPSYVTWVLMGICIVVFIIQFSSPPAAAQKIILSSGLIPALLNDLASLPAELHQIPPELTIITSMFLHGGLMHLGGNMLYLYIFGNNIEDCMGKGLGRGISQVLGMARFIIFYLLCGTAAAYAQTVFSPESTILMVGASGAISGVLGAHLLVYPRANVLVVIPLGFLFPTIRMPAAVVLVLWFALQIFSSLGAEPGTPGVAWYAHIGGFVAGCVLIPIFKSRHVPLFQLSKPDS